MPVKDLSTFLSRFFVVGFYLPTFFALIAAAGALPTRWLPKSVQIPDLGTANGKTVGGVVLVLAAVALPPGLLLIGVWQRIIALFRDLPLFALYDRLPHRLRAALIWQQQRRFNRNLADAYGPHQRLKNRAAQTLAERFPSRREDIQPSRFGNVMRAYEEYPHRRWGLDLTTIQPRLTALLNDQEQAIYEETRTQLAFAVNLSLTLFIAGVATTAGAIWGDRSSIWQVSELSRAIPLLLAYIIYRLLAVDALAAFGQRVRASVDLHRFELYDKLGVRAVTAFTDDEKDLGTQVSDYLLYGIRPTTGTPIGRHVKPS